MQVKVRMEELKARLMSSVEKWAEGRIDDLAEANPRLKVASVYIKRGVRNYLARENKRISDMIDGVSLFVCDENGEVSPAMVFDDLMTMFRDSEEIPFGHGLLHGTIGKGVIRFQLPDSPVFSILFGDSQAIKITAADFADLRELLTAE